MIARLLLGLFGIDDRPPVRECPACGHRARPPRSRIDVPAIPLLDWRRREQPRIPQSAVSESTSWGATWTHPSHDPRRTSP